MSSPPSPGLFNSSTKKPLFILIPSFFNFFIQSKCSLIIFRFKSFLIKYYFFMISVFTKKGIYIFFMPSISSSLGGTINLKLLLKSDQFSIILAAFKLFVFARYSLIISNKISSCFDEVIL